MPRYPSAEAIRRHHALTSLRRSTHRTRAVESTRAVEPSVGTRVATTCRESRPRHRPSGVGNNGTRLARLPWKRCTRSGDQRPAAATPQDERAHGGDPARREDARGDPAGREGPPRRPASSRRSARDFTGTTRGRRPGRRPDDRHARPRSPADSTLQVSRETRRGPRPTTPHAGPKLARQDEPSPAPSNTTSGAHIGRSGIGLRHYPQAVRRDC